MGFARNVVVVNETQPNGVKRTFRTSTTEVKGPNWGTVATVSVCATAACAVIVIFPPVGVAAFTAMKVAAAKAVTAKMIASGMAKAALAA